MVKEVEGTHQIGSQSLYTKSWIPDEDPKAKLIFIHGYSDHVNRYNSFFSILAGASIEIHGFDQRGWGRSVKKPSEKGLTGPTTLVLSDIVSFIKTKLPSTVPVFVLGHSMGGGEVVMLASTPQYEDLMPSIRGWLLEAPFIGFTKEDQPGFLKVFLGRLVGKMLPHRQMYNELAAETLSRDPAVVKSLKEDPLVHNTGTLEGLASMLDRTALMSEGKMTLNKGVKSLWLGHGTADHGTSYDASKKWFNEQTSLKDKEFKTYEGWYHQLHADAPEETLQFSKDVIAWIFARLGPDGGPSKL